MIKTTNDLSNKKYGRLTVIKQVEDYIRPNGKHQSKWLCKCECGNELEVIGSNLTGKSTLSCGCLRKEQLSQKNKTQFKKYNDYEIQEDYVVIYTQKDEPFFVDLEDFWKVRDICWCKNSNGYIVGWDGDRQIGLHQFILNVPFNMVVDHINHNTSDNRKSNLRIATVSQNSMNRDLGKNNTSGVKGVCWDSNNNVWKSQIGIGNKHIYLGSFKNIDDAVKARKEAEEKYFGEYSYDNSITGGVQ